MQRKNTRIRRSRKVKLIYAFSAISTVVVLDGDNRGRLKVNLACATIALVQ